METSERISQVRYLRAVVDTNARLRLEFRAVVSKLLREHGIEIETGVLERITLADEEEFAPIVGLGAGIAGIPTTIRPQGIPTTAPRPLVPGTSPGAPGPETPPPAAPGGQPTTRRPRGGR